jgi:TonB-dependent receptor
MKKQSTIIFLLPVIFLLFFSFAYSQNKGQIQGTITDSTTGDALSGANVIIEGTSLGAASDINGNYKIYNVPADSFKVIVRYIGYQLKEIPIKIIGGTTIEVNVSMLSEVIKGETVVVTAQALGQKEAINQQLTSNTITNIVSAEKIHQLPDASAATALSRLPGISLMNGDQVVIRGIQAKNNLILVNGIQLPSTDVNTRSTNLGFISSNMLSGIEVVKVLTPDMDANAIGGVVNLRLREAPEDWHFDMLTEGSLNNQDRTWDNYRFWASVSNRFFDDKFGVFLQGNADRSNAGDDLATAAYTAYESQPYGLSPYRMDNFTFNDQQNVTSTAGGSLILDYKFSNGSILLQNTLSQAVYNNATHNYQLDFAGNRLVYSLGRDKNDKILVINGLQTEYNFGNIKGELSLSHSYSDKNTDVRFGDVGDATNFTNAGGPVPFLDANGNRISYSGAIRNTLTYDDALDIITDPEDYKSAKIQDWAVLRSEVFDEHIYNAKLDFNIPVSFSTEFSSIFKIGGKFTRTTRANDLTRWYKRVGDETFYDPVRDFIPGKTLTGANPLLFTDLQNTDYTRGEYFLDETYDFKYAYDVDKTSDFYAALTLPLHRAGSAQYDFDGAEIFSAGYLMGSFTFGPRLSLIAGGRYEHYNMDYHSTMFYVTHPVDGNGNLIDTLNTVDRNDDNFFPNAQLRYKFTDWADIRVAYSQTVSRPDYQAILPNTFYNERILTSAGNPKLKPAISTNYDAYLSFYNNEIGLFTVGGFYKEMENVFFQTIIYYGNLAFYNVTFPDSAFWRSQGIRPPGRSEKVTTYLNNPNPAYIKGLEFEWQTNFWYLPQPLNSLVLTVNYTKVWSKMDYQQLRTQPVRNPQTGQIVDYITTDTVRTARLLNQGDDILNVALGVDYKGFSGRISFNFQGNVITTVGSRPEEDQFTGNIYKWDFTLKQQLPIEGLSIQLSGINIFHNVTETYRKFRRVIDGPISDNLLSERYSPSVFQFNLRYTL